MRRTGCIAAGLLVLLTLTGCGGSSGQPHAIPKPPPTATATTTTVPGPLGRWHAAGVAHYRFDYHPSCFCDRVDMRIEVRDGKVVRTTMLPPNQTVPVKVATDGQRPTIDTLLSDIVRAQSGGATGDVRVTYDSKYGVPVSASIDWIKEAVDDEMAWTITNFTPL